MRQPSEFHTNGYFLTFILGMFIGVIMAGWGEETAGHIGWSSIITIGMIAYFCWLAYRMGRTR